MPKRRTRAFAGLGGGGGGVAGGLGGGGPTAGSGASAAVEPSPGPYTVTEPSATRGRLEPVEVTFVRPGEARAASASGNIYAVTLGEERDRCECPDFRFRAARYEERFGRPYACRHIRAVRSALGMAVAAAAPAGVPERERESLAEPRESEAAAAEEAAPPAVLGGHEVRLLDDDAAFAEMLARAEAGPPEYEYEDVLGDPEATFGVEIEFEGGDRDAIARDLYDAGLIEEPRQRGYHAPRVPGLWSFETDGSVSGGELVSPVMADTPEAWRQIEQVCEIVRRHGGRATARCGGHVHIGSRRPLDDDGERWNRLRRLCQGYEDLLFRLAAGGESRGVHRGAEGGSYAYSRPLGGRTGIPSGHTDHYSAVNRRGSTVEFRYFNGTLDPRQIQANVKIAHALVRAATRPETDAALPPRDMRLGSRAASVAEEGHREVRRFLDAIFTRARDKLAALWLYATSRWQPAPRWA